MNNNEMSNTGQKALHELEIFERTVTGSLISEFKNEILLLVNKFGNSGQSGGSAPYVAHAISDAVKQLCLQQPITDIMGTEDEWVYVYEDNDIKVYQNHRCTSLFKDGEDGIPYYLDAIVFRGEDNISFTGNNVNLISGNIIENKQYIKDFPFKPKTFYIDVVEIKNYNGKKTYVKDETQLEEVAEYYSFDIKRFKNNVNK